MLYESGPEIGFKRSYSEKRAEDRLCSQAQVTFFGLFVVK